MIAANHFGAVLYHLDDSFWKEGKTVSFLLVNPYMCKVAIPLQNLIQYGPFGAEAALNIFSKTACFIQSFWQLFMVPLVASRLKWCFWFVKWHGWVFIMFSFLLNISTLPAYELLAWIFIFGNPLSKENKFFSSADQVKHKFYSISVRLTTIILRLWILLAIIYSLAHISIHMRNWLSQKNIFEKTQLFGLWAPNVFNLNDLRLAENWLIFEYINKNGKIWTIPLDNKNGTRGWLCKSDLLYYGNSLRLRRGPLNVKHPYEFWGSIYPQSGGFFIIELLQFYHRFNPETGNSNLKIYHFFSPINDSYREKSSRFQISKNVCMSLEISEHKVTAVKIYDERLAPLKAAICGRNLK